MDKLESIVVGIDFTPSSAVALRQARRMAEWNRARLHPVHIIDTLVVQDLQEVLTPYQRDIREALEADARAEWKKFAQPLDLGPGLPIDIRIDNRVHGILDAVRRHRADLLILGAFGMQAPNLGMGTLATAAVRRAPTKVLLVRDNQPGPFRTIVACVDFSPTSLRVLEAAGRIAVQDGAALHILHVYSPPWEQLHYRSPTLEADPGIASGYRGALERRLREFSIPALPDPAYLKPSFILHDHPSHGPGVVEYARHTAADLVVMGTRGRANLRDFFMGSTAERVLASAPCSILAIKPQDFEG
ncbi:MAG: universal stress protein [Phycisphaerales bacterium]|nr:universal stress protein [Phycisphaerales bacterium]